jgi:hypothetical protein
MKTQQMMVGGMNGNQTKGVLNIVNSCIPPEFTAVQYQNTEIVIDLVQAHGSNCLMSKADIQDAFRLIPIHPSHYIVIHVEGNCVFSALMGTPRISARHKNV